MRRVLAFGTFDTLHPGHLDFFRQARMHGGHLTVVVARDETASQVKGRQPVHSEQERLAAVKQAGVDEAVLGHHGDKYRVILEHNPDVICLGYDQQAFTENLEAFLKEHDMKTVIVRLQPFHPETYKSSLLR